MTGRLKLWMSVYRDLWRRHGPAHTIQYLFHRLVNKLVYYRRLDIIVLGRDNLKPFRPRNDSVLTSELANLEQLSELQRSGDWRLFDWQIERFKQGDSCLLSYVDGALAGYTWVHSAGRPELLPGLVISVPKTYLYNSHGYTHPDFRGYGLQSYRHHAVLSRPEWSHARGLLGFVAHTNFASRRGQAKSGFHTIGTIRVIGSENRFAALFSRGLRRQGIRRVSGNGELQPQPR